MKMTHNHRIVIFGVLMLVVVGAIAVFLPETNILFFKLAVVGEDTTPQTYITCYVKATTEKAIDGKIVETQQSKFLQQNPYFKIVDSKTGKEIDHFYVTPKIRCDIPASGPQANNNFVTTRSIELKEADLTLAVYSKDSTNHKVKTHEERKIIGGIKMSDNKEASMTSFTVKPDQIGEDLKEGEYTSLQEFRVSGTIKLLYTTQSKSPTTTNKPITYEYKVRVAEDDIKTWSEMKVEGLETGTPGQDEVPCAEGFEKVANECVPKEKDGNTSDPNVTKISNLWDEFVTCATTADSGCLFQQKFIIFWAVIVIVLVLVIVIIAAIASNIRPRQ